MSDRNSRLPTVRKPEETATPVSEPPFPNMVWIPGGTFRMGSEKRYPEERPVHRVTLDRFWMEKYPVTNARCRAFVEATGHVTFAEIIPNAADYRWAPSGSWHWREYC
jgi:sulfatase modifying factor 1